TATVTSSRSGTCRRSVRTAGPSTNRTRRNLPTGIRQVPRHQDTHRDEELEMDSVPTYDDRQLAVAYAVEALKTGRGVTGRVVAELYDRSERWGRMRVSEARTALQSEGIDVPRPTPVANMSPAHSACNTARGNVPLAEWHTRNGLPDGIV